MPLGPACIGGTGEEFAVVMENGEVPTVEETLFRCRPNEERSALNSSYEDPDGCQPSQ